MKFYKELFKLCLIIPITVFFNLHILLEQTEDSVVSEELWNRFFGFAGVGDMRIYAIEVEKIAFLFIFVLLFGNFIFRNFCTGSAYIFTRINNRTLWYSLQTLFLLVISLLFSCLLVMTNLLICAKASINPIDQESYRLFIPLVLYISLLILLPTMAVNIISLIVGNLIGMVIVIFSISFFVMIAITNAGGAPVYLINPFYLKGKDAITVKTFTLLVENTLLWLVGCHVIKKHDILFSGEE